MKTFLKRAIASLLTIVMLFSLFSNAVFAADAQAQSVPEFRTLVPDEEQEVIIAQGGEEVYFTFTPPKSDVYILQSFGDTDSKAYIYDSYMGDELAYDDDSGEDSNFLLKHYLSAGTTYFFKICCYGSETGTFNVNLSKYESEIESIVFNPIEIFENTNGYWDYDYWASSTDYGSEYYYYAYWTRQLTYTVTFKNGSTIEGSGTSFYHDGESYYLDYDADQGDHNKWTAGKIYYATITLDSAVYQVPISIIENPIKSIEFDTVEIPEYTNGYWSSNWISETECKDYFRYSSSDYIKEIPYKIIEKDGDVIEGITSTSDDTYIEYNGIQYPISLSCPPQSYNQQWTKGNTYKISVDIYNLAISSEINVCIVDRNFPVLILDEEQTINIEKSYDVKYFSFTPEESGVYKFEQTTECSSSRGFIYDYYMRSLDSDTGWSYYNFNVKYYLNAGTTYYFRADSPYGDLCSFNIKLSKFDIPIESIEFKPVEIIENTNGHWSDYYDYDLEEYASYYNYNYWTRQLYYDVHLKNGEVLECNGISFNHEDIFYPFEVTATQDSKNQWTVGSTQTANLSLWGIEYEIPVTIIENPIKSIEFETVEIPEYTNGYWTSDWISETESYGDYFYYYIDNSFCGIPYKITEKDGDIIEGTIGESGQLYLEYEGERFNLDINYDNQSYDNQLLKGNTYPFSVDIYDLNLSAEINLSIVERDFPTLTLGGEQTVCIEEADKVTYFSFTPEKSGVYIFEETDGPYNLTGHIYDDKMISLVNNSWDTQFKIRYYLEAGKNYSFGVSLHEHYFDDSCNVTVKLSEFDMPIESIEFNPIEIVENTNGRWCEMWDHETDEYVDFYCYDSWYHKLSYTVNMKDGETIEGNGLNFYYSDFEYRFDSPLLNYDPLAYYDLDWSVGKTYTVTVSLYGEEYQVPLTIVESPIESISFKPIELIENEDGYWDYYWDEETDEEKSYFYYEWYDRLSYTVTMKNGDVVESTNTDFYYNNDWYYFDCSSNQDYDNFWTVGNAYSVSCKLINEEYEIPVSIIQNPIEKIEFTPVEIGEYTNGYWNYYWNEDDDEARYYHYDVYSFIKNLTYKIFERDGDVIEGAVVYNEYDERCIEYNGEKYYFYLSYEQGHDCQWTKGNTYPVTVYINDLKITTTIDFSVVDRNFPVLTLDEEQTVNIDNRDETAYFMFTPEESGVYKFESIGADGPVNASIYDADMECLESTGTIYEDFSLTYYLVAGVTYTFETRYGHSYLGTYNVKLSKFDLPIESIVFNPISIAEYANGYWNGYYDEEADSIVKSYYYNSWEEKTSFVVTMKNGDVIEGSGWGFYDNNDNYYRFRFEDNQDSEPWTIGNNQTVTATLYGSEYEVPVIITENPIESIEFNPITIIEHTCGEWEYYWDSETDEEISRYCYYWADMLSYTVTMKNGDVINCSGPDFRYNNDYYNFLSSSSQTNEWTAGNTYTVYMSFGDLEFQVPVSIIKNPIEKIEILPLDIDEYTNGQWNYYWDEDDNEIKYYRYDVSRCLNGATYKITEKDGDIIEGTISKEYDPYIEYLGSKYYLRAYYEQDEYNIWTKGNSYPVSVEIAELGQNLEFNINIVERNLPELTLDKEELVNVLSDDMAYVKFTPEESGFYTIESFADVDSYAYLYDETMNQLAYDDDGGEGWNFGLSYRMEAGVTYIFGMGQYSPVEGALPVKIAKSELNIKKIEFKPISIIENTCGSFRKEWDDETGEYITYYHYENWYNNFSFTITLENGDVINGNGTGFDYKNKYYSFNWSYSQGAMDPWTVGNTYTITTSLFGMKTDVPLSIIESPIESITVDPIAIPKETNGNWNGYYDESDNRIEYFRYYWYNNLSYTIKFKDGTQYKGTNRQFEYNGQEYTLDCTDSQNFESSWVAGNTYTETISALGVYADVEISILNQLEKDGIKYMIQNGSVVITGITGSGEQLIIPETIDDCPVTAIVSLKGNGYKEIIIPDSVVSISHQFLVECYNVEKITIGSGITYLTGNMFESATDLKEIIVSEDNADYVSVDGIVYDKQVSKIIAVPRSKETRHTVPETVDNIDAYMNGYYNFEIVLQNSNTGYVQEDGIIYNLDKTVVYSCSPNKTGKYVMPDSVTTISNNAFKGSKLTEVTVSNNVSDIVYYSFAESINLEKVVLPDTLTAISQGAFYGCSNLTDIELPSSLEILDSKSFANSGILNADIPSGVEIIAPEAFFNSALEKVTIAEGVAEIDYSAFSETKIKTLKLPDSIRAISEFAFYGSLLEEIDLGNGIERIGDFAFYNTNLQAVSIPESLAIIGESAFAKTQIKNLEFKEGVSEIRDYAFAEIQIETLDLPESVTDITYKSFVNCTKLNNINLPDNLESLDGYAFYNTAWYNNQPDGALYLEEAFYFHKGEMAEETDFVLKNDTKLIADFAFGDQINLKSIYVPKSVKSVGYRAFVNCENLTDVYFEGSEEESQDILIEYDNDFFVNANWHYNVCDHEWKDATCTEAKTCKNCGTSVGSALGHDWKDATCTEAKTCKTCGDTEGTALGHKSDSGTVTKKATCSATGTKTYKCTTCNTTIKTETIAKTSHKWSNATCTSAKTCSVCKATSGSALGHKSDSGTVTKKATCSATGTKTYKCTTCKTTLKTETIAKISHKWDSGKVTKKATCKATGTKTYTCSVCKGTKTSAIAKTSHSYSSATCTKPKTCKVCSATSGKALGHDYKTKYTKATTSSNGKSYKQCDRCDYKTKTGETTIYKISTVKLSSTSYTYDGKVKKPSVTVKDSKGKTISSSYYTVTYASGRKNVGKYSVTVKFKTKYSGSKTLSFTINPVKTTVSKLTAGKKSLTVAVTKKSTQVTGYEIQYSTSSKFKSAKTKTISSYKTTKATIKSLSAKKTYYVRVRTYKTVSGKKYYSGWSSAKSAKTK